MSRMMGLLATLLVGVALGVGASRLREPPTADAGSVSALLAQGARLEARLARLEARLSEPGAAPAATGSSTQPAQPSFTREMLREELSRLLEERAQAARPTEGEPAPAAPAALTPGNVTAMEKGQRVLNAALAARRWRDEDALEFRKWLGEMSPEQREQAMLQVVQAINSGQLAVESQHGLF